jgi:hypothetical protein
MKKMILMATVLLSTLSANAQDTKTPAWINNVKLSGYGMFQYRAEDQENAEHNEFQLRLVRLALDGRASKDWYWKIQMQINGTPRLVDAFTEWQKYDFFKVKGGQFKRPFTFENPMHPITQGFMSYSQPVSKLAGFSDRTGEQASNGRDLGVQVQGDFLKNKEGRYLLHYQVGVFNGQGINVTKDGDERKDIIGGAWVMPVEGMRIGAFGWTGSRDHVSKNRYAISGEYVKNDWTFRSEYIHSQGYSVTNATLGDKADGWYALCIAPIVKNKFHVKARYDCYRNEKTWESSKTYYEIGADYSFNKNTQLFVEYALVNNRAAHKNHSLVDVQLDFRF